MTKHIKLSSVGIACVATALIAGFTASAKADAVMDFYKGKNLKMIIVSGAGGGYDTYSRFLARHINRHIPGNPSMINQNMPGASGIKGTNWLYNVAPRDGSVMGMTYNTDLLEPLLGNKKALFDPTQFEWIGSVTTQYNTCMVWHTSPVKTIEDAKKQQVRVSTTGLSGNSAKTPLMLNTLLGTQFKVISGYNTRGMRLAVERGEVEGICGFSYDTYEAADPGWLRDKKIRFLVQDAPKRIKQLPDVPLLSDFVTSEKDKQALEVLSTKNNAGRPYMFPPKVPQNFVAALRKAFDDTMKDPKFLAEAAKLHITPEPMTGAEVEAALKKAYAAPKDVVAAAAKLWPPAGSSKKKK